MIDLKSKIQSIGEAIAEDGEKPDLLLEFNEAVVYLVRDTVEKTLNEWLHYNKDHLAARIDAKTKLIKELRLVYEKTKDVKERSRILKKILDLSYISNY